MERMRSGDYVVPFLSSLTKLTAMCEINLEMKPKLVSSVQPLKIVPDP